MDKKGLSRSCLGFEDDEPNLTNPASSPQPRCQFPRAFGPAVNKLKRRRVLRLLPRARLESPTEALWQRAVNAAFIRLGGGKKKKKCIVWQQITATYRPSPALSGSSFGLNGAGFVFPLVKGEAVPNGIRRTGFDDENFGLEGSLGS